MSASLGDVLDVVKGKTQMARRKILKEFLHSTNKGEIPETEKDVFKKIFSTYYTPDEGQVKLAEEEIKRSELAKILNGRSVVLRSTATGIGGLHRSRSWQGVRLHGKRIAHEP